MRNLSPALVLSIVAVALLAGAGCGDDDDSANAAQSVPPDAREVPGGCDGTPLKQGANPEWTASARPPKAPYAMGRDESVAAFVFAFPLRAGHPDDPANKVLWIVRRPRDGNSLVVSGRRIDGASHPVRYTLPPSSGPGEIYPSIIDVPAPGCWRFTVRWGANTDELALAYRPQGD